MMRECLQQCATAGRLGGTGDEHPAQRKGNPLTTERDELADLAWSIEGYTGLSAYAARSLARDLQDAGYRKPRTVTTAAELDAAIIRAF